MSLCKLVGGIAGLPDEAKRRISSIVGAVVADSASLPLEWIYKDATMKEIVGDKNPEFWPESKCPFYSLPTGSLSCYGDELITCLASMAKTGQAETGKVQEAIVAKFGAPDSPYQIALAKRADKVYPVPGPWINGGVIKSLSNIEAGTKPPGSADCEDNDGLAISLPCALSSNSQEGLPLQMANLLTTCPTAVSHLPLQLEILNNHLGGVEKPIQAALAKMKDAHPDEVAGGEEVVKCVENGASVAEAVAKFGKACGLPGSFQGSLATLLLCHDFVSAVRSNILAGGDCNARALLIGSCLGAKLGVEGIPMEWIEKVHGMESILEDALKVYASS